MPSYRDLSIAVIHYNTPLILQSCLKRLERFLPDANITVVDSGSTHETAAMLKAAFSHVTLISTHNHSLAHAVNTGLKASSSDYLAHMNADVFVGEKTFAHLLEAVQEPATGMVGPLCLTPSGEVQNQGLPYRLHSRRVEQLPAGGSMPVPWLAGCLQLIRREVLERVGGMDSSLRFYNEDMDLCWRIRRAGMRCQLVYTGVLHLGGSSTPKDAKFIIEGYRGGYLLSQRYQPPWYRVLHRRVVLAEAYWRERYAKDPLKRAAYRQIARMFREGMVYTSPFGPSLSEANPEFFGGEGEQKP